jgi:hypothetical protein
MAERSDRPPESLVERMERQRRDERISPMVRGRTHHPECWRDPSHHVCAVARIETLEEAVREAIPWVVKLAEDPPEAMVGGGKIIQRSVDRLVALLHPTGESND